MMQVSGRKRHPLVMKFQQPGFYKNIVVNIVKYILLVGLCFIILYPFIKKFSTAFMSQADIADPTVQYLPRNPTLFNFKTVIEQTGYFQALFNTAVMSLGMGLLQMFFCTVVGYGFAKFRFRGSGLVFALVIFTLIIPPQTLSVPYYMLFRDFDLYGLFHVIAGQGIKMLNTPFPVVFLSITGLGFKNGLYIFLMRQFFRGVPKELSEAAEVDGAGVFRTFWRINLPQAKAMMLTVFLFAFAWQWTDNYYSGLFYDAGAVKLLNQVVMQAGSLLVNGSTVAQGSQMAGNLINTASILVIGTVAAHLFNSAETVCPRSGIQRHRWLKEGGEMAPYGLYAAYSL